MKRTKLDDRVLPVYTKGEEIFNMVTHIVGGAMGIAALVLCIIFCHDGYGLFSGIVYGTSWSFTSTILLINFKSNAFGFNTTFSKSSSSS